MVKTRSSDSPYFKKTRPRYNQPSKPKQPVKKRKKQPCRVKQEQQSAQSIDPDKFLYRTRMISSEQSYDPSLNLVDMPNSFHQSDLDLNNLEMIAIMEHKSDEEDSLPQDQNERELSHASTEKKLDQSDSKRLKEDFDSQFGFTMQGNRISPHEFKIFCERQGLDLSCNQVDIEVQQQISERQLNHHHHTNPLPKDKVADDNQQQPYISIDENQQSQHTLIEQLQALADEEPNLVPFGPPNIDQLSTNYSLNADQPSQMAAPPQIHHIFIQNDQNIIENLSDGSTRPCMSHPDQESLEVDAFNHFSDEEYNELLWNIAHNQEGLDHTYEEMLEKLRDYLDTMGKFVGRQVFETLTKEERIQFWMIMNAISLNLRDQNCIRLMVNFVTNFQYSDYDEKYELEMEYHAVKARLEGLSMVLGRNSQEEETARLNQLLNEYLHQ